MNRIQNLVEDELGSALFPSMTAPQAPCAAECGPGGLHCLFTPLHYERNYAYPLIVWLHGPEDDEQQVTRVMPLVSTRNYVAVAPRGTLGCLGEAGGYRWSQKSEHIALADERVLAAVADARRWLNVAPARIFVAGFDCGGTMAFRMAFNHPDLFAGVLSIGGAFPSNHRPLARLQAARRLRVFLATGRDSSYYPQDQVCETLRLFHSAGLSVNLRQYPCGDDLTTNMLSDMDRWIMEQIVEPTALESDKANHRTGGK
jgi:phospholipase/carboxylesterase